MKTLYFDCFSGISGDMTIGALLDLGLELGYLKAELKKLPVSGYRLEASRVVRANVSAMKFDVLVDGQQHSHGHDHAAHNHVHAHAHHHGWEHTHEHVHTPADHEQGHGNADVHHHHKASDILGMIRDSRLNANTKRIAAAVFTKLAISEGRVHHIAPEDVEFHEVGAVDSIVDTVGSAIGFDALGVERFLCSAINVGGGFIHCQHGVYPVPAPATADLLLAATVYSKHATSELVTPTGAAILAAVVNEFRPLPEVTVDRIGYGAGSKQFQDFPNCLRLMLCSERTEPALLSPAVEQAPTDTIVVLEANIDDMSAQNFAYVCDRLLEAGALDACTIPIQMKKGRPGHLLQVLAPHNLWETLRQIVFEETTTIGVRHYEAHRSALERESVKVQTIHGSVPVKVSRLDGKVLSATPEYEDCATIARERRIPLKDVQRLALRAYFDQHNR
jgi:uncharacterized protein (TIGR00299 family) protein